MAQRPSRGLNHPSSLYPVPLLEPVAPKASLARGLDAKWRLVRAKERGVCPEAALPPSYLGLRPTWELHLGYKLK